MPSPDPATSLPLFKTSPEDGGHLDSYRHFISSDKNTSKEMGKAIGNYITFSKQLFNIKNAGGKNDFEMTKLKDEISKNQNLINKQWLLSSVAVMEKAS